MKKVFRFWTVAILSVCAFCIAACGSEDDETAVSYDDVAGSWKVNTSKSTINSDLSESILFGDDDDDEDSEGESSDGWEIIHGVITFNTNKTFTIVDGDSTIVGTYAINGNNLSLTYSTEEGVTVTVAKGQDIAKAFFSNEETTGVTYTAKVEEHTIAVNGDELTMNVKTKISCKISDEFKKLYSSLGGLTDFSGNITENTVCDRVSE